MRKVIVNEFMSLDGSPRRPGGVDEDTSMVPEAPLEQTERGLLPAGEGTKLTANSRTP